MPKKMKGEPFGLTRYGMLRGKTGKPFWFSSLGQMVQFGAIIFCRTFVELFWPVQVVLKKKTLTKSHDYSRLFCIEKRRLKTEQLIKRLTFTLLRVSVVYPRCETIGRKSAGWKKMKANFSFLRHRIT